MNECSVGICDLLMLILSHRDQKFRKEFANIAEIRSLTPKNANILALTATANRGTQKSIVDSLEMRCFMLWKLPNNQNCSFLVPSKPKDQLVILQPIIDELVLKMKIADKHCLIFCRNI